MTDAGQEFLQASLPCLDLVNNLARRLAPDRADAEDLVQETYTRAWAAWAAGKRPTNLAPWLATICLNAGRDRLRRASARAETPWEELAGRPGECDVEAEAIGRLQRRMLERALWRLTEEQRVAITLMDLCGFTATETAKLTGSPRGTVLARVHRGRKALARLITEPRGEVADREAT
jgi:RNA polymerase sigma-70 factor, ECF subfamily